MFVVAILVGIAVTLVSYLLLLYNRRLNYWQSRGIACEKPHWFLGNFTGLRVERSFADIWLSYYKRFKGTGPFVGFYWFSHPAVVILDTSLMKSILIKDFNQFMDRGFYHNDVDDPLTGQLFFLDGLKWKTLRQKLTPTFSSGKISAMFPLVKRVTTTMIELLGTKLKEGESVLDFKEILARFGTDVIGCCAFGIECNSLTNPQVEFHRMGKRLLSEQRYGELGTALIINFPNLMKKLHLKIVPDDIHNFFMGVVKETVRYREENPQERHDFMELLLELTNTKQIKSEDGEEVKALTIEEVAAQVVLFFLAGYETSSTTLSFALYELAMHEDIQKSLRKEVTDVWESNEEGFTCQSLREMPYLHQVLQETMRLYTAVPVLNRQCLEDYVVPDHPNYVIKKGMNVMIPVLPVHRDSEYYPNPNEFNPDHFLPSLCKDRDTVLYMPFGEGPRNCIGQRFGEMQTRLALATLVKNFKFSVCEQTHIPATFDKKMYFLAPEKEILLKVEQL